VLTGSEGTKLIVIDEVRGQYLRGGGRREEGGGKRSFLPPRFFEEEW